MKKTLYFLILILFSIACAKKHTRNLLHSGDYDAAIFTSVENLRGNKHAKRKQEYIWILQEAFAKAKERDLRLIETLSKDANPANFEKIFNTYVNLNNRQELIRPLLPLRIIQENRNAFFSMDDYSDQIIDSKNAMSKFLYDQAVEGLKNPTKMQARAIYDDLTYLDKINPNYKNTRKLIDDALIKGTDFVHVYTQNETNMIIPVRLQNDLLDFSTLGLNNQWTVYHNNRQKDLIYDFGLMLNFREINVSPEQIREKEFVREKQIKDGVQNLLDSNGNVVRDSLGKVIKVDKFKTVTVSVYEFTQFKSCQVVAKVDYIDFQNNQLIDTYPLVSEFVFEHVYAKFTGDKRAVDDSYFPLFDRRAVPFPSNEQMVFDTGEDLKLKLKNIITRNRFRR
jgi:hypothetical protein